MSVRSWLDRQRSSDGLIHTYAVIAGQKWQVYHTPQMAAVPPDIWRSYCNESINYYSYNEMQKAWTPSKITAAVMILTGSDQGSDSSLGRYTHNNDGWMFLTPWNRVILDTLTAPRIVKKFPAFCGNRRVHYSSYNWPSIIPIMSEIKPVRVPIPLNSHFNTLRTGLLNCLNARSRGLTFRHRASCI